MPSGTSKGAVWAILLVAGFAAPAAAQKATAEFTVSGTSTIRSWTCLASGSIEVTPGTGSQPVPGFTTGVQSARVTVPVKNFKCPNEEMTQHLLESMKADKFSEITYRLEKYAVTGTQAQATGTITVTGVSEPITFPVTLEAAGQGLRVTGSTRLDMTKFGVDPPNVMLGMLRVGPQIRIAFTGVVPK